MKKYIKIFVVIIVILIIILGMVFLINNLINKDQTNNLIEIQSNNIGEEKIEQNNDNSFVGTIIEETTKYMIVEPNADEIERKSSDRIVINYETDHKDYLYGIGRKVIIKYDGTIRESYPAQINSNEILTDGYKEFEITVKKSNNTNKTKILNNKDLYKDNPEFDLYYYGIEEVNVFINNKTMSLKEALESGKLTIDGIIAKANEDAKSGKARKNIVKDGGSAEFCYDKYTIIKMHSLDGNRDVYIGTKKL